MTKHIEIKRHFIKDHVKIGDCELIVCIHRWSICWYIFTKSLIEGWFIHLIMLLGMTFCWRVIT